MTPIILRRVLSLAFVLFSITLLTFIIGYLAPGDPILVMMGSRRDPVLYERLLHQYGLDLPWWQQYLHYIGGLLHGDLGLSYKFQGRPVLDLLRRGLPISMSLGGVALLLLSLIHI